VLDSALALVHGANSLGIHIDVRNMLMFTFCNVIDTHTR
jgi:hypothetical protein